MDLDRLGEFGLIARLASHIPHRSRRVVKGIGDDCAVYSQPGGNYLVVTADALIESVHFDLNTTTPEQLGWKTVAVNASDVAAMGAAPRFAVVTLGIPKTTKVNFLDRLYKGLGRACEAFGVDLVGGDTVSTPEHWMLSLTMLGETRKKRLFTRKGAKAGDAILMTGTVGDSALGLQILKSPGKKWSGSPADRKHLIQRHLEPTARVKETAKLAKSRLRVTSMIDVSDGLGQDLGHLLSASEVGAELWEASLPLSKPFENTCIKNGLEAGELALGGGEDYELLFTLKSEDVKKLLRSFVNYGTPVTQIGEVTARQGVVWVRTNGRRQTLRKPAGFNHFKENG
ncbi:Thiamine-monophosphate kinase [Nitrospina gracilis 3/211]|uniref:Thiamine-monophosphate kinase n=1 Tax=Nitrospina gracilis (strain 3/211) TaxID=1266370 RepID=M1Z1E8_NITG3|nr:MULTISPECIES: thiamine-phosphate kinase [Nitrospina]MCF8724184.1 thiamine-monophosphate kinase [Nitrospina sp. Nb-3]CCQ91330.1 Thiamine-monophosphate kinase [Nitrospina gracilis 3/211]